jgi:hypothetical protein
MLIQIGETSATVTPYGSLSGVYHTVGNVGGRRETVQAHSNKLVWRRIFNLLLTWQKGAKPHKAAQLAAGKQSPRILEVS